MGFSLKKLLEGAAADINIFDGGKSHGNMTAQPRNQPTRTPAQTPPPQSGNMNFAGSKTYGTFNRPSPVVNAAQKQIAQTPKIDTKTKYAQVNAPSYGSGLSGLLNRARDVVDANTAQDRFKRTQIGQPEVVKPMQQSPVINNFVKPMVDSTARSINTFAGNVAKAGELSLGLDKVALASAFGSDQDYLNARRKLDKSVSAPIAFSNNGGLLHTGTHTKTVEDLNDKKKFYGSMVQTGTDIGSLIPVGTGAKLAAGVAQNAGKQLLKQSGASAVLNLANEAGRQLTADGKIDPKGLAISGGIGAAFPVAGYGLGKGAKATTQLASKAADPIQNALKNTGKALDNFKVEPTVAMATPDGQVIRVPRSAVNGTETSFAKRVTPDGNRYVELDRQLLNNTPREKWNQIIRDNIAKKFQGNKYAIGGDETKQALVNARSKNELSFQKPNTADDVFKQKGNMTDNLDELINTMHDIRRVANKKPNQKPGVSHYISGRVPVQVGDTTLYPRVDIEVSKNGSMAVYDIAGIKEFPGWDKVAPNRGDQILVDNQETRSANIVPQNTQNVNPIRGLDKFKLNQKGSQVGDIPNPLPKNQGGYAKIPFGKDVSKGLSKEQTEFINDYANMLEEMGTGNGVYIDKNTGVRMTQNYRSPELKGKSVTKEQWFEKPIQNALNKLSIDNQIGAVGKNVKDNLDPQVGKTPQADHWTTPLPDNGPTPIPKKLDSNGVQIKAGDKIEFYGASPDGKKGTTTIRWQGPYKANASGKEFPGQWLGNGTLDNNIPFKIIERDGKPFSPPAQVGKTNKALQVEQTPFGPVKAKTPTVNQTVEQQAISPNKTMQPQPQTKPLDVNGKNGNDPKISQKQLSSQTSQPVVKNSYSDNTLLDGQTELPLGDVRTFRAKVLAKQSQKQVPVSKVTSDGDRVIKTNVKNGAEKRFAIDANGELQPDTKGAYRLFTDKDGKVTSFRIGNKVYDGKDFGDLSQVNNYGSTIATMRRNIERAYKDNQAASDKIQRFIVDHQQHQATKMIERQVAYRDAMKTIADDLGINFSKGTRKAKQVSADIQNFGEGSLTKQDLVAKYGDDYANKIVNADKWFREQYDVVLNEMNNTLTKYGYDPIPRRSNYYTHFQDENVWKKFGIKMDEVRNLMNGQLQEANPTGVRGAIPSKLAGESEYLLPNKKFNPYALKREGGAFTPDAFQAFEKYLNPALNNIYMTPSITRTRVLAKAIAQNSDLAGTSPSKLIVQMREWANHLAGKTNRIGDRQAADSDWASTALKASEAIQRKVGQQSIVGNVATAVMQPVVLAQTSAKAGYKNTMLGIMQEFSSAHSKTAPIRQSEFMRRRYLDTTPVTAGKLDKASNVASTPLKVIEETAGRITWNSYYNQALEKGFKGKEAIRFADVNAEKTMAGRAIGEKPELYRSKSAGMATQFQLEVNNMWQQLGKEFSKKDIARFVVASYALNMGMQQIIGRQPSFNPLDAVIDSAEIAFDDEKSPQEKAKQIAQRVGGEVVGSAPILPQVIGLFMDDKQVKKFFGTQTPVGRFGVGSTFRSFGDNTIGKVMQGKPLEAGAYLATPFGYNQAQKTVKGIQAVNQGELKDENGQTTVQIPKTPLNYAKGALFGPSAIPEVNAYYSNIGVDKRDQKTVPNQTNSVASRQGQTPVVTREDQMKDAKQTIKNLYGKDWSSLSESEIETKAFNGDPKALEIYNSLKAQEKVYAKPNMPTPGLSKGAEDILNQSKKFTETGKGAWGNRPTESKEAKNALKGWINQDVPVTNDVAVEWAKFEQKRVKGELSPLEENEAKTALLRKAVSSTLNEDERKYYNVADDKLIGALQKGWVKPDSLAKALDVDAQLLKLGLITKSGFGKKVWNALGIAMPTVAGASSGIRSSGRKSSRVKSTKVKTTKTPVSFTKVKNRQKGVNSSLRKLLGSAKV